MSPAFLKAFDLTLGKEGGYVNDPLDPGGETRFGISKRDYPDEDLKALTTLRAREIYYRDFWLPLRLDEVSSPEISAEIFDTAVNAGKRRAAYIAQQALVYLGVTVAVDGTMGPETVRAINAYGDEIALLKTLNGLQFMHYYNLVKADPSMTRFARGWLKRIEL